MAIASLVGHNMNAKCFCGHRLSQHMNLKSGGNCALCSCDHFTESLVYTCEVCNELISILEAPNKDITRLRFKDDGKNYAHTACLSKRKTSGLMGQNTGQSKNNQTWAKGNNVKPLIFNKQEAGRFLGILARFGVVDEELRIEAHLLEQGEDIVLVRKILDYLES